LEEKGGEGGKKGNEQQLFMKGVEKGEMARITR